MDGVELIVSDYRMSISKTSPEVIRFQIRVVREDGLRSFPLSEQTENEFDGNAHVPNNGFATKNLGVHCYTSEKSLVDHVLIVPCHLANIFRWDIVDLKRLVGHAIEVPAGSNASNTVSLGGTAEGTRCHLDELSSLDTRVVDVYLERRLVPR